VRYSASTHVSGLLNSDTSCVLDLPALTCSSCPLDPGTRSCVTPAAADDDLTGTRHTEIGMSLDTDGCPQQKEYDYLLKFLLVGDSDVGKQEMLNDLEDGSSESPYCSGSGNDMYPFLTLVSGKPIILLDIILITVII